MQFKDNLEYFAGFIQPLDAGILDNVQPKIWGGVIVSLILILISVAFFTLLERKVLGYIHLRKGPNKPGPLGIIVPFADAIKLFTKEINMPTSANRTVYKFIALVIIMVPIIVWITYPLDSSHSAHKLSVIMVLAWLSVSVYGTLGAGWRRNRKYALLGAIRATAQTVSYEVRIRLLVLRPVMFIAYDFSLNKQIGVIMWILMLWIVFNVSILAESNRSPFDFAEGESELVSGFNTEYRSVLFVIIFLAEYMSIIFISLFSSVLFVSTGYVDTIVSTLIVAFFYVWARGTLPRFRYDQLIYLAWKSFLPISISILIIIRIMFNGKTVLKTTKKELSQR